MKTAKLPHLLSRLVPAALAIPLCLAAGCLSGESADDETATATAASTQSFGNTCHILRPYSWNSARWRCVDSQAGVLDMATGETADLITSTPPPAGWGEGHIRLTCNADGSWTESRKFCGAPGSGTGGN